MAIEVATAADLDNVRNNLSGDYILMANIDLDEVSWTPIGPVFSGYFDGNNKKVININAPLFAGVEKAGVENLTVEGDVTYDGSVQFGSMGLFSRWIYGSKIKRVFAIGSVSSASANYWETWYTGGFTGTITDYWRDSNDELQNVKCEIDQCCFVGDVSLPNADEWSGPFGGFAGTSDVGLRTTGDGITTEGVYITDCFARGSVNGNVADWGVGGFLGMANDYTDMNPSKYSGHIKHCYAACSLTSGSERTGGFIGWVWPHTGTEYPPLIINCYYDSEVANRSDTGKGAPRTTAAMTHPENFDTTYIDWDFETIWRRDPGYNINDGYPHLFPPPVGFNIWVYKSGEWLQVTDIWVREGGAWKPVSAVDVNKDGWKPV